MIAAIEGYDNNCRCGNNKQKIIIAVKRDMSFIRLYIYVSKEIFIPACKFQLLNKYGINQIICYLTKKAKYD